MRRAILALALSAACGSATAQAADRFYAYNMTTSTQFSAVYLAPAGTQRWGRNQTLNDKDHGLETSERLAITGVSHGRFDVKLQDSKGRVCIKRGVDLTKDTTFDIRDADLSGCR
jgi:opacity protein-like surface antigen